MVNIKGLRIAGLGGSVRYRPGPHQYTQKQMEKRARHLTGQIRRAGGVDILVTHAPPRGLGDTEDLPHQGFDAFLGLMDQYAPRYMLHGHVHLNYGAQMERVRHYGSTTIVNAFERQVVELEPAPEPERRGGSSSAGLIKRQKRTIFDTFCIKYRPLYFLYIVSAFQEAFNDLGFGSSSVRPRVRSLMICSPAILPMAASWIRDASM